MKLQVPDAPIAQTMLWIWVAIVAVALVLAALWRRWRMAQRRRRHAPRDGKTIQLEIKDIDTR